jgi:hypothetical protein
VSRVIARRASLVLALAGAGCDYEANLNAAATTDTFLQVPSNQVDILWVVDNSSSMNEEQAKVTAAAAAFIHQLESAEMDFHLGVVSTDADWNNPNAGILQGTPRVLTSECRDDGNADDCTYSAQFQQRVLQGVSGSDKEKGLQAALKAVTEPVVLNQNEGFLRDDALLMVIVVSDENDCSDDGNLGATSSGESCYENYDLLTPVADLVRGFRRVKQGTLGSVVLSGIVGPDVVENCDNTVPGKRYRTAIQMLGGIEADICLLDYAPVMESMGIQAADLVTIFQLGHAADPATIKVSVDPLDESAFDVVADEANGWTYLEDFAQIQFNGESVPPRGASITVSYTIAGPVPEPDEEAVE